MTRTSVNRLIRFGFLFLSWTVMNSLFYTMMHKLHS